MLTSAPAELKHNGAITGFREAKRELTLAVDPELFPDRDHAPRQWIPFHPEQIKSAIGNNGQYDATNPDIRYSVTAPLGTRVPNVAPAPHNIINQRVDGYEAMTNVPASIRSGITRCSAPRSRRACRSA